METKEVLTFTKVAENSYKRYYKLSKPVFKVKNKGFDLAFEINYAKERIKEEYKSFLPDSINVVCVSDAHTHIERLMLWAFDIDGDYGVASFIQIDGENTMMVFGGDEEKVYPDEYYLRRLAEVNGCDFKVIDQEVEVAE